MALRNKKKVMGLLPLLLDATSALHLGLGHANRKGGRARHAHQPGHPDRVEVRGRDLAGDLMGRLTLHRVLPPAPHRPRADRGERFFLDLLLVSIAEHGLMPTNVAARMTLAADPGSLHGAVAAGILGAGPVVLGTVGGVRAAARGAARRRRSEPARVVARDPRRRREGARLRAPAAPAGRPARRADPGARRRARRQRRPTSRSRARCATPSPRRGASRCTMNVAMPIAAVLLDLGFPPAIVKAVPILARTAGLLAHLAEEQEQPDRLPARARRRGRDRAPATDARPAVETRRGTSSSRSTTRATAAQLAYLFERSPFYREKLGGSTRPRRRRARRHRRSCRSPRRTSCARPAAARTRSARSSAPSRPSSSGSTRRAARPATPSYIPLTAGDLDNWVTGSARSYAASGIEPGERVVTTYNAGPFVAGAALDAVRADRRLPHPGRHREQRAAAARDRAAAARGGRAHAVVRAPTCSSRGRPARLERRARARRGRAGRRRAGVPRDARGGLGRDA